MPAAALQIVRHAVKNAQAGMAEATRGNRTAMQTTTLSVPLSDWPQLSQPSLSALSTAFWSSTMRRVSSSAVLWRGVCPPAGARRPKKSLSAASLVAPRLASTGGLSVILN